MSGPWSKKQRRKHAATLAAKARARVEESEPQYLPVAETLDSAPDLAILEVPVGNEATIVWGNRRLTVRGVA